MTDVSDRNFGYLIAYVIPGFIVVAIASRHSDLLRSWIGTPAADVPTVAGFLYVTMASIAAGMTVSAVRWLLLDFIHPHTGVAKPAWDFSTFQTNRAAFSTLAEQHYRYYQFFGNTLVALAYSLTDPQSLSTLFPEIHPALTVVGWITVAALLFTASRDALQKYYSRTGALLRTIQAQQEKKMTNGFHHDDEPKEAKQQQAKTQKQPKPPQKQNQPTSKQARKDEK